MATAKKLPSGQAKISLRMVGPATSTKPQTMRVSVDYHTRATGGLAKEGKRVMNAMMEAAKVEDAKIYAEQNDDVEFIDTPLLAEDLKKIVSQRLMVNKEEFIPFGIRDATDEEMADETIERW